MRKIKADIQEIITQVVGELSAPESYAVVSHRSSHHIPMPSVEILHGIVEDIRSILFPGYFGKSDFSIKTMPYYVGATLDTVARSLLEQVKRGFCFSCEFDREVCDSKCLERASRLTTDFIKKLPHIGRFCPPTYVRPMTATRRPKATARLSTAIRASRPSQITG
jgi:serine O-acetyltransferase